MNRQIGEVTSMVKTLTEKITNSREENGQNVRNNETSLLSDMETRVLKNRMPTPNTQLPRRTPQSFHEPQIDVVKTEIRNLRTTTTDGVIEAKILQNQVPLFHGNREKYNEFEHVLKINLRLHVHKLT